MRGKLGASKGHLTFCLAVKTSAWGAANERRRTAQRTAPERTVRIRAPPCREERRGGWPRSRRAMRFPKHVNYGTNAKRNPGNQMQAPRTKHKQGAETHQRDFVSCDGRCAKCSSVTGRKCTTSGYRCTSERKLRVRPSETRSCVGLWWVYCVYIQAAEARRVLDVILLEELDQGLGDHTLLVEV
eukprot:COSAG06_NODE_18712_length_872_cov_1.141009_1_plen_185_part_00